MHLTMRSMAAPLRDADARPRPRCARQRRHARRRPPAGAQQLREPRLPGRGCDDAPAVVAKFYRPARWSDAQILEEHAFVAELAEREIPVVAPLGARRPHAASVRRLPLRRVSAPRRARARARRPRHAGMARPLHRAHPCGRRASRPSRSGPRSTSRRSATSRATACWRTASSRPTCAPRTTQRRRPGARRRARAASSAPATSRRCACTAIATPATCCGPTTARISSTSTTRAWARRCRTCGCCCRASAPTMERAAAATCSTATRTSATSTARELHLVEALRTLRLHPLRGVARAALGRSRVSGGVPVVQHAALLAGPHPRAARAGRADGRAAARGLTPK